MEMVQDTTTIGMKAPLCSVCIANYNGEALLPDCIDSVLQQECDFDVEIIVHDDASKDASVDLLRDRYPQVKIIESAENVGFCIANNRMAEKAQGEYILLLNNDAALHSDALSSLSHKANSCPKPAILTLPQYDWTTDELVDRGMLLDPFYNPIPNLDPDRDQVAYVIGACLWIPRSLWISLQGFPEWMESIAEDMYLCCLARLYGNTVAVTGASGYRHRQGASFGGNKPEHGKLLTTYRRRRLSERNKTAVMLICTPGGVVWPLFSLHCALIALEASVLSLLRLDPGIFTKIYWPAILDIFRRFPYLRKLRRMHQNNRTCGFFEYFSQTRPIPQKVRLLVKHGLPAIRAKGG